MKPGLTTMQLILQNELLHPVAETTQNLKRFKYDKHAKTSRFLPWIEQI